MFSLFINNKHGSLVYQRNFAAAVQLTANEAIRLASTFHGLSAIAAEISPVQPPYIGNLSFIQTRGIRLIEANGFNIQCLETLTGPKFILVVDVSVSSNIAEEHLKRVYIAYTDYALKNPFYDLDMPIRCELFDREIDEIFAESIALHKT